MTRTLKGVGRYILMSRLQRRTGPVILAGAKWRTPAGCYWSHRPSRRQGSQQTQSFVTAQFRQADVVISIGAMVAAPDSVTEQKSTTKGLR